MMQQFAIPLFDVRLQLNWCIHRKQSKQSAGDGNSGHAADLEKNEDEEVLLTNN